MGEYWDTPGTESGKPAGCRVYRYGLRLARSQGEPVAAVHKTNRRRTNLIPRPRTKRDVVNCRGCGSDRSSHRIERRFGIPWSVAIAPTSAVRRSTGGMHKSRSHE